MVRPCIGEQPHQPTGARAPAAIQRLGGFAVQCPRSLADSGPIMVSAYSFSIVKGVRLFELQVGLRGAAVVSSSTRAAQALQRRRCGRAPQSRWFYWRLGRLAGWRRRSHWLRCGSGMSRCRCARSSYLAAPACLGAAAKRRGRIAVMRRGVARQLAALRWARADVAIMPWSRPGSWIIALALCSPPGRRTAGMCVLPS